MRMKKDSPPTFSSKGFTLAELLVVVAVIGILSSVAVPSYKKFLCKTRTTEATMKLAEFFMVESSIFANYSTYASCVMQMGFSTDSFSGEYYRKGLYHVGTQTNDGDANWGNTFIRNNYESGCTTVGAYVHPTGVSLANTGALSMAGGSAPSNVFQTYSAGMTVNSYNVVAVGAIKPGLGAYTAWANADIDAWSINQDKKILHLQTGY